MSTAVSSISAAHDLQTYFQQRRADLSQLGQALRSGDLAASQDAFATLQTLAQQHSPFASSDAFYLRRREQNFTDVGQALQAGDLYAANQSFGQLQGGFTGKPHTPA